MEVVEAMTTILKPLRIVLDIVEVTLLPQVNNLTYFTVSNECYQLTFFLKFHVNLL